jgi:protoheme IX farnesyltransferase
VRGVKRVRWLALSLGLVYSIPALIAPGSFHSPSRSILIVLGILANAATLASFPALWRQLHTVSSSGLLAVTAPIWLLTHFVLYLLRLPTPESGYLFAYQIVISIFGLLSLVAVLRQPVQVSSELSGEAHAGWRDYLMLTKPIVVLLLLVTTLAAMIIAAGKMPPISTFLWTALGGALSAGGASALNQYIDRERDGKMSRTQKRPLPGGRMNGAQAVGFGLLLCIAGFNILALRVNFLSAVMAFAGMVYYVLLYSIVLKPTTALNIVVGGGAGAIPPLVGWAAATNSLSMPAFFLFALIFFWTPPHFWALALLKNRDYERAGVPMFPVVYGEQETRVHILLYAIQLVALTLLLPLAALGRGVYLVSAVALGLGFLIHAWRLWRHGTNKLAWNMYRYSSTYLALIFVALVVDTLVSL